MIKVNVTPIALALLGFLAILSGVATRGLEAEVRLAVISAGGSAFAGAAGLARSENG